MAMPVVLVEDWGIPVTNCTVPDNGMPMTVVSDHGMPVVLVESGGLPVRLLNPDGSAWEPEEEEEEGEED